MDYSEIKAVNFSTLKAMSKSPAAYRYAVQMPREDTPAMLMGRAVHCAVFEPDAFDSRFVVYADGRRAGKTWEAFKTANLGAEILKPEERLTALAMRDAVRGNPMAAPYLTDGLAEVTIEWDAQGIPAKGRIDWIGPEGVLVELKTTRDVTPRRFQAQAADLAYHAQVAWYKWGAIQAGFEIGAVKIIAVENLPPYDVIVYDVPLPVLAEGEKKFFGWLDRLAECTAKDEWPGMESEEIEFRLPAWAKSDDDDLTLTIGGEDYAL